MAGGLGVIRGIFALLLPVLAGNHVPDPGSALDQATGQEDDDQHEQQTERQVPALADEGVEDEDDEVFQQAQAQEVIS